MTLIKPQPLVSIVITCFNQGRYLSTAVESILSQSYNNTEIVLVDDGSTDNTHSVAEMYPGLRYVYQSNQGLSSARNTGIEHSLGEYLVFLDADDWLLPEALATNLNLVITNPEIAFVSGAYRIYYEDNGRYANVINESGSDSYLSLLKGNFIGMHATVMFARWVFYSFRYNTTLHNCEDYEMYLNVSRKFPILSHQKIIAVYRYHSDNMSKNYPRMLAGALTVMKNHEKFLITEDEKASYKAGIEAWKIYYSNEIYNRLKSPVRLLSAEAIERDKSALLEINKELYNKLKKEEKNKTLLFKRALRIVVNKVLPELLDERKKMKSKILPKLGVVPVSTEFGYDRGGPVDRYYIENFLKRHSGFIRGRVLEVGDNDYTLQYGGAKVEMSEILHVDATNNNATIVGDLTEIPDVPDNSFDCIVLTQTLHLIYDFKKAIETCHRILKSSGVLILTVPGISHIGQDQWGKYWQWSFTSNSLDKTLSDVFGNEQIKLETFGNVLVASAFLYGLGLPELTKEQMDYHDKHYQVIIAATATKK